MLYQPDEDPSSGRPSWVKIMAMIIVAAMVLVTAGAVVPMLASIL